jgi:hypothetical protein
MATGMNPAAPQHLPAFITAPGESDIFLNGAAIFLVIMVITLGSVYFRLHALPEHMAHKNANKLQFEVVAILALLALFTHNTIFWVAALLLALVPIPDFHGPLAAMADSLARIAGYSKQPPADESRASQSLTAGQEATHFDEAASSAGREIPLIATKLERTPDGPL